VAVTAHLPDWSTFGGDDWPTLVVGNGMSINVWGDFQYARLFDEATLKAAAEQVFTEMGTTNFEQVLEVALHGRTVVKALKQSATLKAIDELYEEVQDALFGAVRSVHIPWGSAPESVLAQIEEELRTHSRVFTTNYDLIPYWAIMTHPNDGLVDLFWNANQTFDRFDSQPHQAKTPIYYVHGGLHLWQEPMTGEVGKWVARAGENLVDDLEQMYARRRYRTPLFVSEGSHTEKLRTIGRSEYLDHCFEQLRADVEATVIFGSSLSEVDKHLLDAIAAGASKRIAIGMRQAKRHKIEEEKARLLGRFGRHKVDFFDAETHPLGDASLRCGP
jgi:hypothetical protein